MRAATVDSPAAERSARNDWERDVVNGRRRPGAPRPQERRARPGRDTIRVSAASNRRSTDATESAASGSRADSSSPTGTESDVPALNAPDLETADEVAAPSVESGLGIDADAVEALPETTSSAHTLDSYAHAPPSHQAVLQSSLSSAMGESVAAEAEASRTTYEILSVSVDGDTIDPSVPAIQDNVPAAATAAVAVVPAPVVDVPSVEQPTRFAGNDGMASRVDRLPEGDRRSEAIENSIDDVATLDPNLHTDPGPAPVMPREGGTDPAQVDDGARAAIIEADTARAAAAQAVVNGPGPEVAQPRSMTETRTIEATEVSTVPEIAPEGEADALLEAPLTPDVLAQFDADAAPQMQASLTDVRARTRTAETDRDQQREAAVAQADADSHAAATTSAEEQRSLVTEARADIQTSRQSAIDEQAAAVTQLDTDARVEGTAAETRIEQRVSTDEESVRREYATRQTEAEAAETRGDRAAVAARERAQRDADNQGWWDRAVNFVKQAFAALTAAIGAILDAVRDAVKGALDAARDFAKRVIGAAVTFVISVIHALAAAVTALVTAVVGTVFPELARRLNDTIHRLATELTTRVKAVGERLRAGVDAIVDKLKAGIDSIVAAFKAALAAAAALITVLLSGDWSAVLRMVLEAALKLVGIEPEAFYRGLGQVLDVIGLVIDNPGQFLANVLGALLGGVRAFGRNFLRHLQTGIIGWLTGALGGSIEIPERFDIAGVISLVRQILGLTWDWLRQKAVRLVGEANVERLEWIVEQVNVLRTEGWEGLIDKVKEGLDNLKDQVLSGIKEMLVTRVIIAGITWLASVFNPVGALVKIVKLVWDLYTFVRDQLSRITAMASAVFGAIADIARGMLTGAITKVEEVLANMLPVAIDLIARVIGLGSMAGGVRRIITRIRDRIDRAVNRLLDRVLARFRNRDRGADAADDRAGQLVQPVPVQSQENPGHTVRLADRGTNADVMLHSTPIPVATWLTSFETETLDTLDSDHRKREARGALRDVRAALTTVDRSADVAAAANESSPGRRSGSPRAVPTAAQLMVLTEHLARGLALLMQYRGRDDGPAGGTHEENLKDADPDAQPDIGAAVVSATRRDATIATSTWTVVRTKLADPGQPGSEWLRIPLRNASNYGRKAQARLSAWLAGLSSDKFRGEAVGRLKQLKLSATNRAALLSNRVLPEVHQEAPLVAKIQARMFAHSAADPDTDIHPFVEAAVKNDNSDPTDPELLKVVGHDFMGFLKKVAQRDDISPLSASDWPAIHAANRTYIDNAFRTVGGRSGQHEWIPTSKLGQVITHAQSVSDPMGKPVAALWVEFHDKLRSPTDSLIFAPTGAYRKVVSGRPDTPEASRRYTVLQGHIGAVWAPLSGDVWTDDTKGQTKGSPDWHRVLGERFTTAAAMDTKAGMTSLIKGVETDFKTLIWDGEDAGGLSSFPSYRSKKGVTVDDLAFTELTTRFKAQRTIGKNAIVEGKKIVAKLG